MLTMTSSSNCEQSRRFYLQVITKLWSHQEVCLKQDTRSVTARFKTTVQQNKRTHSLRGPVAKRFIFKFTYTFTFQIKHSKSTTIIFYMSATSVRLLACNESRGSQPYFNEFITWNSTEIWQRKFYWHLVQEILLTFGTGDSTDIW